MVIHKTYGVTCSALFAYTCTGKVFGSACGVDLVDGRLGGFGARQVGAFSVAGTACA